jgi:hypothetical protein
LLAHELTHVVQQERSPAKVVQRQPDPAPPSKTKAPRPKTLKDMGVSARDPVSAKTMVPLIDAVFKRNPTIAPYIADRLAQGREIGEKGKFIVHPTAASFQTEYEKYLGKRADSVPRGFYWEFEVSGKTQKYRDEIHVPPDATFGEAFHESVHKMSALSIPSYLSGDPDLAFDLNEGLTSLFSVLILKDEGVTDYTDGYSSKRRKAEKLVDDGRFDAVAKWYWTGTVADLLRGARREAGQQERAGGRDPRAEGDHGLTRGPDRKTSMTWRLPPVPDACIIGRKCHACARNAARMPVCGAHG